MWECVDFYPVAINGSVGLDTTALGPGIKHVLKASLDDTKVDHYAIGTYDMITDKWTPDNPEEDVGIGLKVDYGRYYASKTFFDQSKQRRILYGWVNETDSEADDLEKGWASIQVNYIHTYITTTSTTTYITYFSTRWYFVIVLYRQFPGVCCMTTRPEPIYYSGLWKKWRA